jgi:DNA-binding CsgD family transcriptional regulator
MTLSVCWVGSHEQVRKHNDLISRYVPHDYVLSAVDASGIAVVICDRRFRYKALNDSAAEMHRIPVEGHLAHTFHEILGNMAEKVVPLWDSVFASGKRLSNLHVTGRLPKRSGAVHFIENLFPLLDRRGRVAQVGCFAIEVPSPPIPGFSPSSPSSRAPWATDDKASSIDHRWRTILTAREQEVVRFVAEGKSNKEISSLLAISVRTVETYRARLMLKLQLPSVAHLVQYAIRNHIITL